MLHKRETVIIINPSLEEDIRNLIIKEIPTMLQANGCKGVTAEDWGVKKLAYPLRDKKTGHYASFNYYATDEVVNAFGKTIETAYATQIIKYITVQHEEVWEEESDTAAIPSKSTLTFRKSEQPDALDVLLGLAKYN